MARFKSSMNLKLNYDIEVSDQLIADTLTPEWRKDFYQLFTPEDVASHLAYNMLCNGASLSMLDGFADQPRDAAVIHHDNWEVLDEEVDLMHNPAYGVLRRASMKPLATLGAFCAQIDRRYLVSLRYGAHTGEAHGFHITVDLPQVGYYIASDVFNPEDALEMERTCANLTTQIRQRFSQRFPTICGTFHEESTSGIDHGAKENRCDAIPR